MNNLKMSLRLLCRDLDTIIDCFVHPSIPVKRFQFNRMQCGSHFFLNIYILIALALDEIIILDVPQFPLQNIYQSCDLDRAIGRRNVNASQ